MNEEKAQSVSHMFNNDRWYFTPQYAVDVSLHILTFPDMYLVFVKIFIILTTC